MDGHEEFIVKKKTWIEERRREGVDGVFRATALMLPMPPSLHDALLVPRCERAVIPHICREKLIAAGGSADDISTMVRAFTESGASAFIVSTFMTKDGIGYDDVLTAAQNTHVPVICGDMVIDPLQCTLARAHGAAAVLLCAHLLDVKLLRHLRRAAQEMSLQTILDVSSVRHVDSTNKNQDGQGGNDFRIYGADLFCLSSRDNATLRQRLAYASPEYSLMITKVDNTQLDEVDARYHAFVLDANTPDIDTTSAKIRAIGGEISVLDV